MKKTAIYFLIICLLFLPCGCGTPEGEAAQRNPYFYEELCEADQITLSTKAQYYDPDTMVETDIHIQGYKVKTYREGSLYRLTIEPVGDLEQERLNLYFYVTAEKIYRVWTDIVQGDEPVCLCGNDTLLTGILDTDEKLKENSEIVCQPEDVSVVPGEGESGLRYEIHRSGNRITYSRSDVQPNGERGFYEWFAWEKGAGLVEYGSGFKAEADILYLYDITVETRQRESGDVIAYSPLQETQGLEADSGTLPRKVWEEAFQLEGEEYTVSFERVSPIYDPGYESGEIDADYRLTVRDGEENILSQQMVFHYPVRFEEVYWLVDFSGDGFSDIAFCTDLFRGGKHGSWSVLKLLIWNADAGCYEEERINGAPNLPMWNMDTASLVTCADTRSDSEIYWSKEMYAWIDGRWRRTGRFERVYSESELSDMPGEGEKHPYADGYRELVYSEGELVEENRIEKDFYENDAFWFEESCIWSDNYKNGIKLYPDWPEWEKVETEVGGIILQKYVRAVSGTD